MSDVLKSKKKDIIARAEQQYNEQGFIDIIKIANGLGISVDLDKTNKSDSNNYSSAYIKIDENDKIFIYINENECIERQRFSVAHEIAHYVLHLGDIKQRGIVGRNSLQSLGYVKEREADNLAAQILMPENIVRKLLTKNQYEEVDYDTVIELAKKLKVSKPAMTYRLLRLRYNVASINFYG